MTMTYRPLGDTGMHVSSYCLGTMMLGAIGTANHVDGARIIHAALDAGINFIDTADMYSAGESEQIVGKPLLAGATTTLGESTLDRIDEIVPPGTNAYELEGIWSPPELTGSALRRRPLRERAAS